MRIVLLVAVIAGLGAIAGQNWSPILPLVFLGVKSQPLPLALWIIMAIALGVITSFLLQIALYLPQSSLLARIRKLEASSRRPFARQSEKTQPQPTTSSYADSPSSYADSPQPQSTVEEIEENLDEEEPISEEWDDWQQPEPRASSSSEVPRDRTTYERQQEPKSSSQSGTVYSYGYRDPNNSGVGKTETVYDADYRVIKPPSPQKPSSPENDWESPRDDEDDDWKF